MPCKGGIENPCSGNGKCKVILLKLKISCKICYIYCSIQGGGTRKGNGHCDCNKGYKGELCTECSLGFYESYKDESKTLCDPCNQACDGPCTGVSLNLTVFLTAS